jgi:hypothetical protein
MYKKYVVRLSDEERGVCQEVIKKLKGSSQKARRAQILLKADADGPAWPDAKIAEAFNCRVQTIETVRKRLVTEGNFSITERMPWYGANFFLTAKQKVSFLSSRRAVPWFRTARLRLCRLGTPQHAGG